MKTLIERHELNNGLILLLEKNKSSSAAIQVAAGLGSALEKSSSLGAAHFLEHVLFTGSRKYTRKEIFGRIDEVGGELNAYTSMETTRYYSKIATRHLDRAIELLADCLQSCRFHPKEIETERNIILNEISESWDRPLSFVFNHFLEKCFNGSEFGRNALGTAITTKKIKRKELIKYFKEYYVPNNLVIGVSGDFSFKEVRSRVESLFKRKKKKVKKKRFKPPCVGFSEQEFEREIKQAHICMGFPLMNATHSDYYGFQLINTILGGGLSSRLQQEIREKRGLCYQIHSDFGAGLNWGYFMVYAATNPKNVKKVKSLVVKELSKLRKKDISLSALKKAKQYVEGKKSIEMENALRRAQDLVDRELYGWPDHLERLERINSVDVKTLKWVARRRLLADDCVSVVLKPRE